MKYNQRQFGLALVALGAMWACHSASEPAEPAHFLWSADAQSLNNPFPDLRLWNAQGQLNLRPNWYQPFLLPTTPTAKVKGFLDGYGTQAVDHAEGTGRLHYTLLPLSAGVNKASLAGHFFRVIKKSDGSAELLESNVPVEHASDAFAPYPDKPAPATLPEFALVTPRIPIPDNGMGWLVVTRGIMTLDGQSLGRGKDWNSAADAVELAAIAKALGLTVDDIILTLPQKGAPIQAQWKSLVEWASVQPAPAVTIPVKGQQGQIPVGYWKSTDADWNLVTSEWIEKNSFGRPSTSVAGMVSGTMKLHDLRESGIWKAEWIQTPSSSPLVDMRFVLTVPSGAKPTTGYKVILGAHGIYGRNTPDFDDNSSFCLEMAEPLAEKGFACLGIDAPSHGSRGSPVDFFNVQQPPIIRENFREIAFDWLQVLNAISHIDIDGDGAADLNGSDVSFFGQSLGAIMGSLFVPLVPSLKVAVLNVPGGGLTNMITSPSLHERVGIQLANKSGIPVFTNDYYASFPLFRVVAEMFVEPADPLNVQSMGHANQAVLVQEGLDDHTIPNATTENLASLAGLQAKVATVSGTDPLRVLMRVDPAQWLPPAEASMFDGHEILYKIPQMRTQAVRFLETSGTEFMVPPL